MISQTAEYALRAVLYLAEHAGSSCTTQQIATAYHVPIGYLSKVMQSLARSGLVRSHRGLGGGFMLACDPATTSIFDVVQAVDPFERLHSCPNELSAMRGALCMLQRRINTALRELERTFRETTLQELVNSGRQGECLKCRGLGEPELSGAPL